MIKFLDLQGQYQSIKSEIDSAMSAVILEAGFIGGAFVEKFESEFSQYLGSGISCLGVGNGTDALEIAIEALDLPPSSDIIVPMNSFIASGEAVTRSGHNVVFADICPETHLISVDDVTNRITSKTSAIIAVHLYGHPCEMSRLNELCNRYSLRLIEDCAQAHGSEYRGTRVGGLGDIAAFSFYPGKTLGAYGDGGAITSTDQNLILKAKKIANHGRLEKYDHEFEGRNSRLDGLQAAILSVKLKHLDRWIAKRQRVADIYREGLSAVPEVLLPRCQDWVKQSYHLFVIRVQQRDELRRFLSDQEIATGIHYPKALSKMQAYDYLLPHSPSLRYEDGGSELLSLPIGEHIADEDAWFVVDKVVEYFGRK